VIDPVPSASAMYLPSVVMAVVWRLVAAAWWVATKPDRGPVKRSIMFGEEVGIAYDAMSLQIGKQ
jgi:hypothetical protein